MNVRDECIVNQLSLVNDRLKIAEDLFFTKEHNNIVEEPCPELCIFRFSPVSTYFEQILKEKPVLVAHNW